MQTTPIDNLSPESREARPSAEVPERPKRRHFSLKEKRRILVAADACAPGTLGALLRREGIYSSLLAAWRAQRRRGELDAATPHKRTARKTEEQALKQRNAELERENRKLQRRLKRAELILDIQKKAAGLLGIELKSPETDEND